MVDYRAYNLASPPTDATADNSTYTLGLEFYVVSESWLKAVHFFQPTTNDPSAATRQYGLYKVIGPELVVPFASFAATISGWNTAELEDLFELEINARYKLGIFHPAGRYSATGSFFSTGDGTPTQSNGPLRIPNVADALGGGQATFLASVTPGYPTDASTANYWADVTITDEGPVPPVSDTNLSIADKARANMLAELGLADNLSRLLTNVDLMRLVIIAGGLGLITVGNDTAGNHYERYLKIVRNA